MLSSLKFRRAPSNQNCLSHGLVCLSFSCSALCDTGRKPWTHSKYSSANKQYKTMTVDRGQLQVCTVAPPRCFICLGCLQFQQLQYPLVDRRMARTLFEGVTDQLQAALEPVPACASRDVEITSPYPTSQCQSGSCL